MQITIDDVTHDFDFDTLPFDDVCAIEDVSNQTITEWTQALNNGSAKAMRALAFVLVRRVKPEVRWEEIGRLDFADFVTQLTAGAEAAETKPRRGRQADPSAASA